MTRTKVVFTLLAVLILGLVFGWFLQQWLEGKMAVSPVDPNAAEAPLTKPASRAGYCCVQPGNPCIESANPGVCFRTGGRFNTIQANCDFYCTNKKP